MIILVSLVVLVEAVLVQDHLVMVEQELKALVAEEVAVLDPRQEEWVCGGSGTVVFVI